MIKNSTQLKALVRNRSSGNSFKAQALIRNYVMERFLERVSLSDYKDNIILKGGTLIASIIGIDMRSTMDIDTNLKSISLNEAEVYKMMQDIISIDIEDHVTFVIIEFESIMDEADYPGIRVSMLSEIDKMKIPFKIDFSTGDVVTPREISYNYPLMFEERSISICAYTNETIIAEKFETAIKRGVANTRMRDFYDIYMLQSLGLPVNNPHLAEALINTCTRRDTVQHMNDWERILEEVSLNNKMQELWSDYQGKFEYAQGIAWEEIMDSIKNIGTFLTDHL